MELRNIVCPIDGSELTDEVLDAAVYLSKVSGAKVTLVYVLEKWYRSEALVTDSAEWKKIHEGWLSEGRQVLERSAERLKGEGVKHLDTLLEEGDAAYEIVEAANEKNADLIVMATRRYSPLSKLFTGSITDRVSKKSPCPILWIFG